MSDTAAIVVLCVATLQSFIIFAGNTFTVLVFWTHRNKLKRTSFLLINLAVADLLVGLTQMVANAMTIPSRHVKESRVNETIYEYITILFQATFMSASMFLLVLISLERAFALICPLRHHVTSIKTYIYNVVFAWIAAISLGAFSLLSSYGLFDLLYYIVAYFVLIILSLVAICVSYLAIRTRLNSRNASINTAQNRQSVKRSTKLSKTLFIMIGTSTAFWVPSFSFYCTNYLFPGFFPKFVKYMFNILLLTNSFVNPIIYSLRMPVFRQSLNRLKGKLRIRKQCKKYIVND